MEQTIGKRIMTLRKSRSMTQDQLAEKLGVSPQAVSKWENDISCPDISLLPKLAEVFQVTTDSLLGMPEKAELVTTPPKTSGFHVNLGDPESDELDHNASGFTFNFDIGQKDLPWFATAVLLFAASLLLNRTLLSSLGHAGIWDLMWPSAMLAVGLSNLSRHISLWSIGMTGFGGYYLLVNMHILKHWNVISWGIVLPTLLVLWAISMLLKHFRGNSHGIHTGKKGTSDYQLHEGKIHYDASFGSDTITVREACFCGGRIDVSFGDYKLDLTECGNLAPDSVLIVDASFGSLSIHLPPNWKLQNLSDRTFAAVSTHGSPRETADQLLTIKSDISFGTLDIRW